MATCSEVVPVYRPDVAALSVTMDLDKIDATNDFTDVADETYGLLALTDDWREFWSSNVKGKEGLDLDEAKMIYDSPKRQTALYRKALQAESECRRERYFEWTAEVFKQFEAGRTTEFPQKDAPGFVRPFELQTGRLAKDHTAYHRPHIINSDGQQVYCKIRAGKHMSGSPRVFKLPYVPPIPGEQDSDVLTMSEYKARWQRAFKDQLIQEGEYSPYSASVHPDNVRFPDAATPPAFFMQALTAGGAQDAQAAQALDASTVAIRK
jgi:hypothetical protein